MIILFSFLGMTTSVEAENVMNSPRSNVDGNMENNP
jgi:hypothetical protein